MGKYQDSKKVVRNYFEALENATGDEVENVLKQHMKSDYNWKGVYPFREQDWTENVADVFWRPLKKSLSNMQRRQDIFIAGTNEIDNSEWVMSMGHFMGLFD